MLSSKSLKNFGLALLVVAAVIAILFRKSFVPGVTLFANDGPLGMVMSAHGDFTSGWTGAWNDLNWLGMPFLRVMPTLSTLLWYLFGESPVLNSKFSVPVSFVFVGMAMWACLRQFGVRHSVCVLAGIATALNMDTFSHGAWGLAARAWSMGSALLAIALLRSALTGRPMIKSLIAGWMVANGIMEAYDVGAIYSIYVAVIGFFVTLASTQWTAISAAKSAGRIAVVAIFSAVCAYAAINTLIGTQVKGVAGMQQDEASKQVRWDEATMWSLPKAETLRVLIPGLFGYRMDTPEGGNYWGSSGQQPGNPQSRHSGSGQYAGALVVVMAAFAIANAFRKKNSPLTDAERRVVLFFAGTALVSLLLAWGRHAPFYQLVYRLPFFSTIRNPMKFMHPFHMVLLILFGFGLEILFRLYVKEVETKAAGLKGAFSAWWAKAGSFERKWTYGSLASCGLFLLGCFVYISSRKELLSYLRTAGFEGQLGEAIASFSYREAMWGWFYTTVAAFLVLLALSGWFSGKRARYLLGIFGIFLFVDLGLSNRPWVQYYDYKYKYQSNPVVDFLSKNGTPFGGNYLTNPADPNTRLFPGIANLWLEHHFQWYNIQALEPTQMPRIPELDDAFRKAFFPAQDQFVITRLWELTNTRYLVGDKAFIQGALQQLNAAQHARVVMSFDMLPRPGLAQAKEFDDLTAVGNPNGRFAVVEFTGALPRAKLYPAWQRATDDAKALQEMTQPSFNPLTNLFVHGETSFTPSGDTNFQGTVNITSYKPKRIELAVSNSAPAILLYNDKITEDWHVMIDDKPGQLLRANYLMRGIPVPPGSHKVVMYYEMPSQSLYVSLAGIAVALGCLGFVAAVPRKGETIRTKPTSVANP
jgi:hypothetical protein